MTSTDLITLDDVSVEGGTLDELMADVPGDSSSATSPDVPDARPVVGSDSADGTEESVQHAVSPVDQLDTRIGVVDSRLDAVDRRLAELAGGLESTGAAAEAIQARAQAADEAGDQTSGRLTDTEGRLDSTESAVQMAHQQVGEVVDRLAVVDSRLDSLADQLAAVKHQQADHEQALTEVTRTIAAEVERHTTDALVDTQHSLQLAVNSIAQLSLAMAESSRDLTEDVSAESASALMDSFRVDLDAILDQLGFASLETRVGAAFDPHRHRALKRVTTSDPAQDKVITRVIRDGYLSSTTSRILLFADVEVSRHRP